MRASNKDKTRRAKNTLATLRVSGMVRVDERDAGQHELIGNLRAAAAPLGLEIIMVTADVAELRRYLRHVCSSISWGAVAHFVGENPGVSLAEIVGKVYKAGAVWNAAAEEYVGKKASVFLSDLVRAGRLESRTDPITKEPLYYLATGKQSPQV